ncbi:MAG: nucleotide sugar dehydrogenase, partial [Candidatus Thermoplasmatota archaeon]|nr:nucleotide sugar dehydrogenase [Candidatus Thermoplasmatota archaeon]
MGSTADGLAGRIKNKKASIGIVGMGYVGIPLGLEFARNGFTVTGFDKDLNRVEGINAGKQILEHIPASAMREFVKKNKGSSTNEFSKLRDMDCVIICVPTPLDEHEEPDISYISDASEEIGKNLKKGQLIILESTTYPGTTREVVKPILEKSKLEAGKDFFLAYSPEREDPGNKKFSVSDIPKVMGGLTNTCLRLTKNLYKHVVAETVEVSSLETAEATKLMENVFRAVNIAMVNELKLVMDRMGINIWEVV